jgi:hypothetical protein
MFSDHFWFVLKSTVFSNYLLRRDLMCFDRYTNCSVLMIRDSSSQRVRFSRSIRDDEFSVMKTFSRSIRDDELSVMKTFSRHADRCQRCGDLNKVQLSGGALCHLGRAYARDIAKYIFLEDERVFSMIDQERDGIRVQIEIPPQFAVVRNLLRATEMGLKIRKEKFVPQKTIYRIYEQRRPNERDNYELVEVQYEDYQEERKQGSRREGSNSKSCGQYREKKKDEKEGRYPVILYARIVSGVVKLELLPTGLTIQKAQILRSALKGRVGK